jgi:hypothetical protein
MDDLQYNARVSESLRRHLGRQVEAREWRDGLL